MNQPMRVGTHPSEGDLVRFMDHQAAVEERRWVLAHVSGCEACAATLRALGEQSEVVTRYVAALHADEGADELTRARALSAARRAQEAQQPTRTRFTHGWMRAAAVAAVAVGVFGITPVRAWVTERVSAAFSDPAPQADAPETVLRQGSEIAFQPAGDVFTLQFGSMQQAGSVELALGQGPHISARVAGSEGESFTLLPAGVVVENAPSSQASYHVVVPAAVRTVQVFAGGRLLAVVQVPQEDGQWAERVALNGGR